MLDANSIQRPYERQAMKLVDQVLKELGLKKNIDYDPFSGFQDLADYLLEKHGLVMVLGKLPTTSDNFLVEFAKFPKKRLVEAVKRYAPPNVSLNDAVEMALVFPWKSTLFTLTTWQLPWECKLAYTVIPSSGLCLSYWQDYVRNLLRDF